MRHRVDLGPAEPGSHGVGSTQLVRPCEAGAPSEELASIIEPVGRSLAKLRGSVGLEPELRAELEDGVT